MDGIGQLRIRNLPLVNGTTIELKEFLKTPSTIYSFLSKTDFYEKYLKNK